MTLQVIVGGLLLVTLVYAWYAERTRRQDAEIERDLERFRSGIDELEHKIKQSQEAYDKVKADFDSAAIPAHMLDYVGKPIPAAAAAESDEVGVGAGSGSKPPTTH